jgi:hypothetical protein
MIAYASILGALRMRCLAEEGWHLDEWLVVGRLNIDRYAENEPAKV